MTDSTIFLETALSDWLSLDGEWEFRLADAPPIMMRVPCAWEAYTADKITDGPAFYSRTFTLPEEWHGQKVLLEANAVSFDATVRLNGHLAGHHRGLWSPFQIDLTPFIQPGENNLEIEVWKPGGRFPPRESLAGFLPDVCTTFGGIWQFIQLHAIPKAAFQNLKIITTGSGQVDIQGRLVTWSDVQTPEVFVEIVEWKDPDPDRLSLGRVRGQVNLQNNSFTAHVEAPGVQIFHVRGGKAVEFWGMTEDQAKADAFWS